MEPKIHLDIINKQFVENINAIKVYTEEIGGFAESFDRKLIADNLTSLSNIVGMPLSDIKGTIHLIPRNKVEATEVSEDDKQNIIDNDMGKKEEVYLSEEKAQQFIQVLKIMTKKRPEQASLLRQGSLITLTSFFEALISNLLQYFYMSFPSALPSEGRTLTLGDLRQMGSVEDAEIFLIDKEIDTLLRENTETQLEYFSKRLKVDLKPLDDFLPFLYEIMLRRNLFVHNSGIVNKIYIERVPNQFTNGIKEGDNLEVMRTYMSDSIEIVCLCGTILLQQCWRKWCNYLEEAEDSIRDYIFDMLVDKRWSLVEKLSLYVSKLKFASDETSRVILINHAIALKEQGKDNEMKALLSTKDWSSCSMRFQVALNTLKDDEEKMFHYLCRAVASAYSGEFVQ